MSVTLLLVALVVFAFFAGHVLNRYASRYVTVSGAEYLLIGALIGPQLPPRLLTTASLTQLAPLVSLLLGLAGFLVGLETRSRARNSAYSVAAAAVSVVSFAVLMVGFLLLLYYTGPVLGVTLWAAEWDLPFGYVLEFSVGSEHLEQALVLAAAATVTFSSVLSDPERLSFATAAPVYGLLRAVAWWGQALAVVAVGCVLALTHDPFTTPWLLVGPSSWLLGSGLLGVVFGVLFTLFVGDEKSTNRIFLATVGTVTIGAGIGAAVGVSSMFVNLVCGVTVALVSKHRFRLQQELRRLRQAIFVMLLILIGALWAPPDHAWMWAMPAAYIGLRWAVKAWVPALGAHIFASLRVDRLGDGLMGQGTLAVAVAADYSLQAPAAAPLILTTVIVGTLAFDLFSARVLKRLLVDESAEHSEGSHFLRTEGPL